MIDKEEGTYASEPAVANDIPTGMPQTVEEALADLEEGEREFLRGETFSHREVMKMIWDKIATEKDLAVT